MIPAGKPRELFAFLLLHSKRMHHRDALTDILFPSEEPRRARRLLSEVIYRLRQALGPVFVSSVGDYVSLNESLLSVDAWEFTESCDPATAIRLYCGDLLEELDADWLLADRARLRNRALTLIEKHCTDLTSQNQYLEALEIAHRWIEVEALSEQAHCAVMRLYAQLGRFPAAIDQYERLTRLLSEELGVQPSPAAQTLRELVGSEWDRKLASMERAVFVGRERERARLAQLANAALEGHGAIVLVEGAIGVGKTRLLEIFAESARWRGFSVSWLKNQCGRSMTGDDVLRVATDRPYVPHTLLIDDVHSVQSDLWDAILEHSPAVPRSPLIMVLSGRSNSLRTNDNCWRALTRLDDAARLEHCTLEGLSVTECTRLAHSLGAHSSARRIFLLHHDTHGNPRQFLSALKSGTEKKPRRVGYVNVKLTRADVPIGRPVRMEERILVEWTVDAGEEDKRVLREQGRAALRRHRLRRLVDEARVHDCAPTHAELARALGYSVKTIARDFAATRTSAGRRVR